MTTAWQALTANSTLPSGTAWEHLNAQDGGSGGVVIHADGIGVDIDMVDVTVYIEPPVEYEVEVDSAPIVIEIKTNIEVEV
jgi:hypothetical protein